MGLPAQRMPRNPKDKDQSKDQENGKEKETKREKTVKRGLTKRILEDQMRQRMTELWEEVQAAEAAIDGGGDGFSVALDRFIAAAGTMVENFRLARGNFGKNRVWCTPRRRAKADRIRVWCEHRLIRYRGNRIWKVKLGLCKIDWSVVLVVSD